MKNRKVKFRALICMLLVLILGTVCIVCGQPDYSSILTYNLLTPEEEAARLAEVERLQNLDNYSVLNAVDVSNMTVPNGNSMNVIMMIPDGQSVSEQTLTRWYQGYRLGTDQYVRGMVRTHSAESAITDSAAAATAYATGYKTNEGYEGMLPRIADMPGTVPVTEDNYEKPFATVLEAAKLAGKSTGMVVTSPLMHATPAGFSSHVNSREKYTQIAKQQINQGIDVMFGGGGYYLRDGREDGRDLINDAIEAGYEYVTDRDSMNAAAGNKLLGVFAPYDMSYDIDRGAGEPSLEEMTRKAIEVLNRNENGFFLLVEGSKIDYATHAHDPVGIVSESIAFDKAFRAAVEFAQQDGNTIVISCADHANGGMSIGVGQSGYASTNIDSYLAPIKRASLTGAGVAYRLNADRSNIINEVSSYYGIMDITPEEVEVLRTTSQVQAALGDMLSKRANIGWISGGHTGEEVPLAVYAPEGYSLMGIVDNTDVSHFIQSALGVSTDATTEKLFIKARDAFTATGASIKMETISDSRSVIVVEKDNVMMRLPVDTSIAIVNDVEYRLGGLTVISSGRTYVSQDAVDLFNTALGM